MIIFVGDVHGEFSRMRHALRHAPSNATVIQVGDFGFFPEKEENWYTRRPPQFNNIYFIDGNHEFFPLLNYTETTEVWPHLTYVPRGTILEIDSLRIGCLGGGTSIDKALRTEGISWFPEEQITKAQAQCLENQQVDVLVTHTPPSSFIAKHFDSRGPMEYGYPPDFIDPEAFKVEKLWQSLDCPPLVCGHMHTSIRDGNIRLLGICDTYVL
jgi:Icc-related predicted phosphoesterase